MTLRDGDIVSFGIGSASYRFCYVPIVCFLCGVDSLAACTFKDTIASIGAAATTNWSEECTHVIIDEGAELKECMLDAIAAKQSLVLSSWVEVTRQMTSKHFHPSFVSGFP